jgi:hypothetical protein
MFISNRFKAKRKNFGSETKRNTLYQFRFGRKQKFVAKSSEKKKKLGECAKRMRNGSRFTLKRKIFLAKLANPM